MIHYDKHPVGLRGWIFPILCAAILSFGALGSPAADAQTPGDQYGHPEVPEQPAPPDEPPAEHPPAEEPQIEQPVPAEPEFQAPAGVQPTPEVTPAAPPVASPVAPSAASSAASPVAIAPATEQAAVQPVVREEPIDLPITGGPDLGSKTLWMMVGGLFAVVAGIGGLRFVTRQ